MTKEEILEALRKTGGNVREAAPILSTTPQGIYHHLNTDPSLAAEVEEIRNARKKPIEPALKDLTVDEDEVALEMLATDTSPRTAARKLLTTKLSAATGRSAREVSAEIRKSKSLTKLFEGKLPVHVLAETATHETIGVTLTSQQLGWTKKQARGAIAQLVLDRIGQPAPEVSGSFEASKSEKKQTSFRLPLQAMAWLRTAAQAQGTSAQAVLRQVIDEARRRPKPSTVSAPAPT
jgi:hypothetical protein